MSGSPGRQLLDVLRRELIGALHDAATQILGDLEALSPDPAFAGTAFDGRVLAPIQPANPVLATLAGLSDADGVGLRAGLRGWRDAGADGAARGVAYVVSAGGTAVAALTVVPAAGARLTLRAAGFEAGQSVQVPLANGFVLAVSGSTTAGEVAVAFFGDRPPAVERLAAGDRVTLDLTRAGHGEPLGIEGGPSVLFGAVALGGWVANTTADPLERGGHVRLAGGRVALAPGFLEGLLPLDLTFPLDLELRAAPDIGVVLAGSPSLTARVGSAAGRWLDVGIGITDVAGASSLSLSFATSIDLTLPGTPVSTHIDGLGLSLPIGLRLGAPILPDPAAVIPLLPGGAGIDLDLAVVSGSGALAHIGDDLAGALAVTIPPLAANAFAVLSPAHDDVPLSLLVIMGATFPPPGVQVGFGFTISGVGGVVGINRRIDRTALLRAVTDGTAAQLLFPSDPVGAGRSAIAALPAIFPAARGSMIVGPMFQLSWGGRVVTLSVAVLVESATQVRLTVMGKLVVALPDPEVPLVFLQATFVGIIDTAEPSVLFVASLTGSHIVGAALSGDVLLLTRGGSDPTFVLSAGGFHPSFRPPRGVPALGRLTLDLCPAPWIDLRCENYFAVTSNTLQFGARLELVAEVAGCGLRGWLAFDAILQYSPFHFTADMSGGIALRAFGHTLVGISLALHLEGPAPYLARGRGSIDLFLFEVSFDFEIGWGTPARQLVSTTDVGRELRAALADPAAWRARGAAPPGLELTAAARELLSHAAAVDPYGALTVRQERVPLGIEIGRFAGLPIDPQRWDIAAGQFGPGEPARHQDVRADFAPGQFLRPRSDDEALTAPAFLPLKAGVDLVPEPAAGAEARPAGLVWEERVIARDIPMPAPAPTGTFAVIPDLLLVLTAMSPGDVGWWTPPPPEDTVAVQATAPVAAASSWSMAAADTAAANGLELAPDITAGMITVETYELVR